MTGTDGLHIAITKPARPQSTLAVFFFHRYPLYGLVFGTIRARFDLGAS